MNMDGVTNDRIRRVSIHHVNIQMNQLCPLRCQHCSSENAIRLRVDNNFDEAFSFTKLPCLAVTFHLITRHLNLFTAVLGFTFSYSNATEFWISEDRIRHNARCSTRAVSCEL